MKKVWFGPAGNGDSFYSAGYKASVDAPAFLKRIGLSAYEYQCGKGVNIGEKTAALIGKAAKDNNIRLSLHAPYYINLANPAEDSVKNNIRYISESAMAAKMMGADRIVVHAGAIMKQARQDALEAAKITVKSALCELDAAGLGDIVICIETMGKINQLGTLEEVLELCNVDERLLPTVDFGHLNARTLGSLVDRYKVIEVFDMMEDKIGLDRARIFHSHFSKIEYTKGGEKRHLTFEDEIYGPFFEPIAEQVYKRGYEPVFICESMGTQIEDALTMKRIYEGQAGE